MSPRCSKSTTTSSPKALSTRPSTKEPLTRFHMLSHSMISGTCTSTPMFLKLGIFPSPEPFWASWAYIPKKVSSVWRPTRITAESSPKGTSCFRHRKSRLGQPSPRIPPASEPGSYRTRYKIDNYGQHVLCSASRHRLRTQKPSKISVGWSISVDKDFLPKRPLTTSLK